MKIGEKGTVKDGAFRGFGYEVIEKEDHVCQRWKCKIDVFGKILVISLFESDLIKDSLDEMLDGLEHHQLKELQRLIENRLKVLL